MPPTIHFVRHAQGAHNTPGNHDSLLDPGLTEHGKKQCEELRASFPHHEGLAAVIASPMSRAIQTSVEAFARPELGPVVALDLVQETSDAPNDIGSSVDELRKIFGKSADLTGVRESWTDKSEGAFFEPEWNKLLDRTREARRVLRDMIRESDRDIIVVSHGGVLHFLTDDWQDLSLQRRSTWSNCEYRSYQFLDLSGDDEDASLRETEESWRRRRGDEVQPSVDEQANMREAVRVWITPVLKVIK